MSDRRFGFSNFYQNQNNRCTLCVTEDDRNVGTTTVCQHNASVESALHYLRNFGAPLSPTYGSGTGYESNLNATALPAFGALTSPVSPNYYTLAEFLLRMNRIQQENNSSNSYHNRPSHASSRPSRTKSDIGCLRECAFCKSNGETAEFYKSHFLKDPIGRVRCPILQRYYATHFNYKIKLFIIFIKVL